MFRLEVFIALSNFKLDAYPKQDKVLVPCQILTEMQKWTFQGGSWVSLGFCVYYTHIPLDEFIEVTVCEQGF